MIGRSRFTHTSCTPYPVRPTGAYTDTMTPVRIVIFQIVVRRLGWFRRFPALVHAFNLYLAALTAVTAPSVSREVDSLTQEVARWPGVTQSPHRYGGREFTYQRVEFGHVHANGVVDVRLTRVEHEQVLARGLAVAHHIVPTSSWVTFVIERPGQAEAAAELLAMPFERLRAGSTSEGSTDENG
jgi:hypothetical protein